MSKKKTHLKTQGMVELQVERIGNYAVRLFSEPNLESKDKTVLRYWVSVSNHGTRLRVWDHTTLIAAKFIHEVCSETIRDCEAIRRQNESESILRRELEALNGDPVAEHEWLVHPGERCKDGCDTRPIPERLAVYQSRPPETPGYCIRYTAHGDVRRCNLCTATLLNPRMLCAQCDPVACESCNGVDCVHCDYSGRKSNVP